MPSSRNTTQRDSSSSSSINMDAVVDFAGATVAREVREVVVVAVDQNHNQTTNRGRRSPFPAASPGSWSTLSTADGSCTTPSKTRATGAFLRRL